MEPTTDTAADVIAAIDDERVRAVFTAIDLRVATALHGRAVDVWRGRMWGGTEQAIVGRGRIVQPRPRGQTARWFLVGVAAQTAYVSVYVNAVKDGRYLLQGYAGRLGRVKLSAAAIAIRRADHLDIDTFDDLLAQANALTEPDAW